MRTGQDLNAVDQKGGQEGKVHDMRTLASPGLLDGQAVNGGDKAVAAEAAQGDGVPQDIDRYTGDLRLDL